MTGWLRALAMALLLPLAGCETVAYYGQAVGGHLSILASARPVQDWIDDPATDEALRERLRLARRIREFASGELALPDNGSYRSYVELGRPYVVWNVIAAPEFSVAPRRECFPFAGCVSYRGFFSEQAARAYAERLRAEGFDVHVGGVPAYSTLGWFDDPLLSSFIRYPDAQLARLVFHELAHQLLYAPNDTMFNESFAVVVEEEGVRRWLRAEGREPELDAFRESQARRRQFAARVKETRERLAVHFRAGAALESMRQAKAAEWAGLRELYPGIPERPNNAFLASIALYNELVPEFEAMLKRAGSLPAFYDAAREAARSGALGRKVN